LTGYAKIFYGTGRNAAFVITDDVENSANNASNTVLANHAIEIEPSDLPDNLKLAEYFRQLEREANEASDDEMSGDSFAYMNNELCKIAKKDKKYYDDAEDVSEGDKILSSPSSRSSSFSSSSSSSSSNSNSCGSTDNCGSEEEYYDDDDDDDDDDDNNDYDDTTDSYGSSNDSEDSDNSTSTDRTKSRIAPPTPSNPIVPSSTRTTYIKGSK
jgi:hypothetical protein